ALAVAEPFSPALDHEPRGPAGSEGEDSVEVGDAAVADPLLAAADLIAADVTVFLHRHGFGAHGRQIAAGLWLGRAIGHQQGLISDATHPVCPLLRRAAHANRVGAKERRQYAR